MFWIACVLSAIMVIAWNSRVAIFIIIHRLRFPEMGPSETVDKWLADLEAYLTDDNKVVCDCCGGEKVGLKAAAIKQIVINEDL